VFQDHSANVDIVKHIYKVTTSYIREEGSRTIKNPGAPDVKKIATGESGASKEMSEVRNGIIEGEISC
jgi:hypothetical protein